MQITIPAKLIKKALDYKFEFDFQDTFSDEALKACGITRAKIIKELQADAKFMTNFSKEILNQLAGDYFIDAVINIDAPSLKNFFKDAREAQDAIEDEEDAIIELTRKKNEEDHVLHMIKSLEKAGFKVTKN